MDAFDSTEVEGFPRVPLPTSPRFSDLTGHDFGRLTVLYYAGKSRCDATMWVCRCVEGVVKVVAGQSLVSGHTNSCGCLQSEITGKRSTIHGMAKTPLYNVWASMIERCENRNGRTYSRYGGRGIRVCGRWRKSFEKFLKDMGPRPDGSGINGKRAAYSIERIDNDGNYEPGNCRWATQTEQTRNRKTNRMITVGSETRCLSEWARIKGLQHRVIAKRIDRGWSAEEAVNTPARKLRNIYIGQNKEVSK